MPRTSERSRLARPRGRWAALTVVGVMVALLAACGGASDEQSVGTGDSAAAGAVVFANNCALCHGTELQGTDLGPPLIHELYVPSHHADASIAAAVVNGVMPHHWDFGAMPAIGLDDEQTAQVIDHIRAAQRAAGLMQ